MNREEIRKIGLSCGADVVGFAAVEDYQIEVNEFNGMVVALTCI
jgi:hypothetical protein